MQKLSLTKQLVIVKQYLGGLSYDEIAAQAEVSKGTVANVVADLKAGHILDAEETVEQLDVLRELAIDLRRLKLSAGQSIAGIAIISRLQELGVEPGEIERFVAVCRRLAGEETQAQVLVRAALYLKQLEEGTGLNAEALEDKVRGLQEEVTRLEPHVQELKECKRELKDLEKRRRSLADEVTQLEKRYKPLSQSVAEKEQRESGLYHRVQELEQRAQAADERLAVARNQLEALAGLGLSCDDLSGFVQRLSGMAQRHGIEPEALRDRLLHELEQLDAGMGSRISGKEAEIPADIKVEWLDPYLEGKLVDLKRWIRERQRKALEERRKADSRQEREEIAAKRKAAQPALFDF